MKRGLRRLFRSRVPAFPAALAVAAFAGSIRAEDVGRDSWPTCHGNYDLSGVSEAAVPDLPVRIWKVETGAPVRSTPVAGGKLIFFESGGTVSAVDFAGGAVWSRAFSRDGGTGTEPSPDSFSAPLLYASGTVVCASDSGAVCAMESATGKIRWRREMGQGIRGQPNYGSMEEGVLCVYIVTQQNGVLICLSLADGRVMWNSGGIGQSDAHPAVGSGAVVVVGCDSSFHAFSAGDGSARGTVALGEQKEMAGGAALRGNLSIAGNRSGSFACVDWSVPGVLWSTEPHGDEAFTIPAVTEDRVVFAGGDGKIYAARLADGVELWSFDSGGIEAQSPVVAGNRVLASVDGAIRVLDLRSGREVASVKAADGITAPAVVGGMFVVGSDGGQVMAFGRKPAEDAPQ